MTIKISEFKRREDLETYIVNELGDDIGANRMAGHTIEGTEEELADFSLSTSNRVYGVKVVIKN